LAILRRASVLRRRDGGERAREREGLSCPYDFTVVIALAYGTGRYLAPDSIGNRFEVDGWGDPYSKHGINQVMAGIEAQKQQDRKTIAESKARECP
jgi:hypothetical protein